MFFIIYKYGQIFYLLFRHMLIFLTEHIEKNQKYDEQKAIFIKKCKLFNVEKI